MCTFVKSFLWIVFRSEYNVYDVVRLYILLLDLKQLG